MTASPRRSPSAQGCAVADTLLGHRTRTVSVGAGGRALYDTIVSIEAAGSSGEATVTRLGACGTPFVRMTENMSLLDDRGWRYGR